MKKLLVFVAALSPAAVLLPAAPASAEVVCAPVTADGQPIVCEDLTPVEQAIADAEATALATVASAEQTALDEYRFVWSLGAPWTYEANAELVCQEYGPTSTTSTVYIEAVLPNDAGDECDGTEVTIELPQSSTPGVTQHIHVPQLCVTTTSTCVGPVDQDVQVPVTLSSLAICTQPVMIRTNRYTAYTGPRSCSVVPLV